MTGDTADIVRRLRAELPSRWFADDAPVLNAVLTGAATVLAVVYGWITYARRQARIATADAYWLDIISRDFFATALPRRQGEADASFRNRIFARLFRDTSTRAGIIAGVAFLTGRTATIIEPWNTGDCGAWNNGRMAWGTAGAWGSLALPNQFFMQVKRPNSGGVSGVQGWGTQPQMVGGWGVGAIEWVSASMFQGAVSDADIYATITDLKAAGTTAWVNISS